MKIFAGILVGITLAVVAVLLITYSGSIDMGATAKASVIEEKLGHALFEHSMKKRAPDTKNPYSTDDPEVLASGLSHYRENCVVCHGAPEVQPSEIGKGLNPAAPPLDEQEIQEMKDGELYWTIENGIRMTGMPAFGPTHEQDEIWKIVAFVRHLPNLSRQERNALAVSVEEAGHHHEEAKKKVVLTETPEHSRDEHTHE